MWTQKEESPLYIVIDILIINWGSMRQM